jgi:hypothetical protein
LPLRAHDWNNGCDFQHGKKVAWLSQEIPTDQLPRLKESLGAHLTVFSLDRHALTIEQMLGSVTQEKKQPREVPGDELRKAVIDKLLFLDARKFQEFISHLLSILGSTLGSRSNYDDLHVHQALEEASGEKQIALIDSDTLVYLILKHYDLDLEYKEVGCSEERGKTQISLQVSKA